MFLDIHALHTLPYSNVNRDGLGSPKSCLYGGVPRIRVSSQSWKRAARLEVERMMGTPTQRTRQIATEVRRRLESQGAGWDTEDARRAGRAFLHAYGVKPDDVDDKSNVLLWVPDLVFDELAALAEAHRALISELPLPECDDKGAPKKRTGEVRRKLAEEIDAVVKPLCGPVRKILDQDSPTISLLGRMLADRPDHTVDGATQVAHAVTVHEAAPDFDYFTAVDDLGPNSGAGHLATAEYGTGTFYRYCTINIARLCEALGDRVAALELVRSWVRVFLTVVPSGKKNSTAVHTVPDLAYLAVRAAPLSLAGGFEQPVTTQGRGYMEQAVHTLDDYTGRLHRFLDDPGEWSGYASPLDTTLSSLGPESPSLNTLIDRGGTFLLDNATGRENA